MSGRRDGAATVGLGVVACAACCAGPIIAWVGALGLGAALGTLVGLIGLAVAAIGAAVVVGRRRRRRRMAQCSAGSIEATPVAGPTIGVPG